MKKFLKVIGFILLAFILIQFIPVDKMQHPVDHNQEFEQVEHTPAKITGLLKDACYTCHSFETVYPDYASVAPVSWVIKSHVKEAREHLNFSEFYLM